MALDIKRLSDVLTDPHRFPPDSLLYCQGTIPYLPETRCIVAESEPNSDPQLAAALELHDLAYTVPMASVADIYDNLFQQDPGANVDELLKAFNFYIQHDAFIQLNT